MFKNATPIMIKALSPVHAGSGRELGIVDMPIQRESHTGIPKIEGSSLKGSMREWTRLKNDEKYASKLFGDEDGNKQAGLIGFSDAKLLFYPIMTLQGIFAYISCPYLLDRFVNELKYIDQFGKRNGKTTDLSQQITLLQKLVNRADRLIQNKVILIPGTVNDGQAVSMIELAEYSFEFIKVKEFEMSRAELFSGINLQSQRHIVILGDDDFIEMISLCKEVITRNRVSSKTGTVTETALFTEEYLPAESILYTLLLENGIEKQDADVEKYVKLFDKPQLSQIGGNVNIGKGIVELKAL